MAEDRNEWIVPDDAAVGGAGGAESGGDGGGEVVETVLTLQDYYQKLMIPYLGYIGETALAQLRCSVMVDREIGAIGIRFSTALLATPIIRHDWPVDWWQGIKARWFPRWLLHFFPVNNHVFRKWLKYPMADYVFEEKIGIPVLDWSVRSE